MVSDKFDERNNEKDNAANMTSPGDSEGKKTVAEDKTSGADAKKAAADGKKPAKKKKIIIVTGGNTQGGQRGAYSSGSGAYNPGGAGGFRSGGTRGGKTGSPAGSGTGGGRSRQRNDGKTERPAGQNRDGGRRQSGAGRGRTQAPPVHKLIKPTIRQTQMEVDFHKPVQQPRKADNVKKAEAEAAAAREAAAAQEAAAAAAAEAAEAAAREAEAAKAAVSVPAPETKAPAPVSEARPEPAREAAAPEKKTPQAESQSAPQKKDAGSRGGRQEGGRAEGGSRQQRGGARTDQPGRQGAGARDGGSAPRGGRGGRPGQGADNRGGRGGNDARGGRPGQGGPAAGGRPGQGPAPAGRGGDKGRKQPHQDKDRRSRKDQIYNEEENSRRNKPGRFNRPEKKEQVPVEEQIKTISVPEKISIRDLAERMHLQAAEIIKKLFLQGKMMTPNSEVSYEEAEEIALGYEILCEKEQKVDVIEELLREDEEDESEMVSRPPVICVMGHVDHGKTSLLDAIRSTNVTGKEAGGITQAIGAYMVSVNGRDITFLDTPGHEAFTAMRMRGANSTDIAILVVAADDGVMPQTIEAINHAKAAGVEIVVAINKIDKDGASPERVKQELTEYELIPTEWGGSTEFVEVSAKTGAGIEDLLETILLTADIMELKANPDRKARGLVLEAKLDKGRGPVANVLVQKGTLHIGDFISAGASSGKVRAMIDDKGRRVKVAKPSHPVEILGLSDVPSAGEVFLAHEDLQTAKSYAETYKVQRKEELIEETRMRMNLDDLFNQMKEGNLKEFNLILKADVQGSVEALRQSLLKLSNEEVVVKVIHAGVGNITESDVSLASASNAVIIGFNVRPDMMAKSIADQEHVDIRLYKVIYQAIDAIEAALKGMLAPIYEERVIGHAQVRMLFKASHVGNIAGSMVIDGVIRRGCKVRINRGSELIYEGSLASLKRFKDDAKEVREGFECGLVFDGFDKMQVDDIVEAYDLVEVPRD